MFCWLVGVGHPDKQPSSDHTSSHCLGGDGTHTDRTCLSLSVESYDCRVSGSNTRARCSEPMFSELFRRRREHGIEFARESRCRLSAPNTDPDMALVGWSVLQYSLDTNAAERESWPSSQCRWTVRHLWAEVVYAIGIRRHQ